MSCSVAEQYSLFRSRLRSRRFDDSTLRILEFFPASKDAMSLMDAKSSLKEFLRFESLSIIRETAEKTDDQKLLVIEFLVRAFALIGDIEAYEHALSSLQQSDTANDTSHSSFKRIEVIEKIKRLKDHALKLAGSHSVQALTSEYLKKKATERNIKISSSCTRKSTASTLFRNGIRNHNAKKLHEYQVLEGLTSESHKSSFVIGPTCSLPE